MSAKPPANSPFLRSQRQFPQDSTQALVVELDKMYIDIAQTMNNRTVGIFPMNQSIVTGESWFLLGSNQRQQALRQTYKFSSAGNIAHTLNLSNISSIIRIFGTFTDGSGNWYPLPYVDASAANNQVSVKVTSTNIVITAGGGSPPTISSGIITLEWTANV